MLTLSSRITLTRRVAVIAGLMAMMAAGLPVMVLSGANLIADNTNKLYMHPYTVTKSVTTIRSHIQELNALALETVVAGSAEADAALRVDAHREAATEALETVRARFLGDLALVDKVEVAFEGHLDAVGTLVGEASGSNDKPTLEYQQASYENAVGVLDELLVFANGMARDFYAGSLRARKDSLQKALLLTGAVLIFILTVEVLLSHRRTVAARDAYSAAEEANAAKSRFLMNMSHELRTPLNAILGFSDLQRQQVLGPMPARYREYSEDIHTSATHLLSLINDVLDMARIEAGRFDICEESFDPVESFQTGLRIVEGMAKGRGQCLSPSITPSLSAGARLRADPRLFQQMFLNLTSNAIKFTPKGGRIECHLLRDACGGLTVEVADNGPGMTAEVLRHVARPFYQADQRLARSHEGSGLGLALVKCFAEAHGAIFTIESAPGSGTRARLTFPPERLSTPEAPALQWREAIPAE